MDERLRFVARLLEGEKMAPLCAEFGISRKTGKTLRNSTDKRGLVDASIRVFLAALKNPHEMGAQKGNVKI